MSQESQEKVGNERRLDLAYEMTLAGKSTREIAAELGVDESAISHDLKEWRRRRGMRRRRTPGYSCS